MQKFQTTTKKIKIFKVKIVYYVKMTVIHFTDFTKKSVFTFKITKYIKIRYGHSVDMFYTSLGQMSQDFL